MKQFDVCSNPSRLGRKEAPYVVILQSHLLDAMPTYVVAPLLTAGRRPYTEVSVEVKFNAESLIASLAELAAIPAELLKPIGSLVDYEFELRRELERGLTGF